MDLDTLIQRILIATGLVFFLTAVVLMVNPGLATSLPFGAGTVGGIGVVTILLGLLNVRYRLKGSLDETETPDPERPPRNPAPGDEVDRMLYEMTALRQGIKENREQLENRLEMLAVAAIRDRYDHSEAEAVGMLQSGRWTDDDIAAGFFQDSSPSVDSDPDTGSWLPTVFSNSPEPYDFESQFRRTVNELVDLVGVESTPLEDEREDSDSTLSKVLFRFRTNNDQGEGGITSNWNVEDSTIPSFDTDEPFEDVRIHRTYRWLGVTSFGLLAVGLGIVASSPALMLAGTIGVVYTVYARAHAVPPTEALEIEREFSEDEPQPGEEIEVTVTMRNSGEAILPNLRVVDVPPDSFVVTEGTPRLHTALRPGAKASFSYTVQVERGIHQWPLLTIGRDFSGSVERVSLITPEGELSCIPSLSLQSNVPVRAQTTQYAGDVATIEGGSGLEFHSVREYHKGDPMNRIDWNRVAMGEDLATIDFRQERAATITLLFDTRQSAYVSQGPGKPHAVDLAVHVASDVFGALYEAGNLVGVAAYDTVPCWLGVGAGTEHLERARLLFTEHPALSSQPPNRQDIKGGYIDPMTHIRRQLSNHSQIFMFSPLVDEYSAEVARRLDYAGHLVTIISPDTTAERSIGQRMTRLERTVRIRNLRKHGIRVVDWNPIERLDLEFERAQARWAR